MNHHVVVEIECSYNTVTSSSVNDLVIQKCYNILYKVPIQGNNHPEPWDAETLSFDGCLAWIENNKVEGSKYAVVKMYLV
jgi:hypothetical protein